MQDKQIAREPTSGICMFKQIKQTNFLASYSLLFVISLQS